MIETGFHQVSIEEYHSERSAYSATTIKEANDKSLSRFFHERFVNPPKEEKKAHFDEGSAFHSLVLEADKFFNDNVIIRPQDLNAQGHRKGPNWKAFKERSDPNKPWIINEDFAKLAKMKKRLMEKETAKKYLTGFIPERTGVYDHPLGLRIKFRPDAIPFTGKKYGVIVDLKTWDSKRGPFDEAMIYKMKYHWSGYLSVLGAEKITGYRHIFVIVAIDKNMPHDTKFIRLSDNMLEAGRRETDPIIEKLANAEKTGVWDDTEDKIIIADCPFWVLKKYNMD